jgi:hypothetical protein
MNEQFQSFESLEETAVMDFLRGMLRPTELELLR